MTFFVTLIAPQIAYILCSTRKTLVLVFTFLLVIALIRLHYINPGGPGKPFALMGPAFIAAALVFLSRRLFQKDSE